MKRHSDSLDFVSKFDENKVTWVMALIFISILMLYGLDHTGSAVKSGDVKEVTIFVEKWEFIPSLIEVKYNQPVKLKLVTSEENETFGFKLSRYMYNDLILVEANNTNTSLEFNAHTRGIFTYRCERPCGYGKNLMIGRLIVE